MIDERHIRRQNTKLCEDITSNGSKKKASVYLTNTSQVIATYLVRLYSGMLTHQLE